ncbi:hypothetical protein JXM67_07390, partial [candidate division WOR-3 bacterium]|nr:hypothetical protein [candidate division WOR-3 bacterium]
MYIEVFFLAFLIQGGVIKDDYLVNSDYPYKCEKKDASVAALPQGWIVVWTDDRNLGNVGYGDVFFQLLDRDGTTQGINTRANTFVGYDQEELPVVVSSGDGNCLICWHRTIQNNQSWFRRRFSPEGTPLEDEVQLGFEAWPCAYSAMNNGGEYIYVWVDKSIMLRVFDAEDTPKGEIREIAAPEFSTCYPKAAIGPDGSGIVVWQDLIDGVFHVFGRRFAGNGEPLGEAFQINTEEGASYPVVGIDIEGDFIVAWRQEEAGGEAVYFRSYNSLGSSQGQPVRAHDALGDASVHNKIGIAVADDGNFALLWSDNRTGLYRVYLQCFFSNGYLRGSELAVSDDRAEHCLASGLAVQGDDWLATFLRTVRIEGGKKSDEVLARTGTMTGSLTGNEVLISDDESSLSEGNAQVFIQDDGSFLVLWCMKTLEGVLYNYGQRFSPDGQAAGDALHIHEGWGAINRATGDFAVIWNERVDEEPLVLIQRYFADGQANGEPIQVDPLKREFGGWFNCDIGMNRSGEFIAVWLIKVGEGSYDNQIVARRFDASSSPIDQEIIEVSSGSAIPISSVPVAFADDGSFIVAWHDKRDDNSGDIFARRFDAGGQPLGPDFKVSDDTLSGIEGNYQRRPSIAADDSGNFCIAWAEDSRPGLFSVAYAQFYDKDGNALGKNYKTDLEWALGLYLGISATPQGGYVFFATDYSNEDGDPEVCARYYHADGAAWTRKIQINQPDFFGYNHQIVGRNCVAANDDRIVYVWLDNRRHKGWDVYAKITDWDVPAVEEVVPDASPIKLIPTLNRLSWDVPGEAVLTVYNSAGRRVAEEV